MIRKFLIAFILMVSSGVYGQQWVKVWSDEFNNPGLPDTSKWSWEVGPFMNGEAQYYTNRRIENCHIDDTTLVIEARKENYLGASYTSSRIISRYKGDWQYGRIEIRAKIPTGKGSFPAIWLMPTDCIYGGWPSSGEIDIMENVGFEPDNIYNTVHFYGTNGTGHQSSGSHVARNAPYDHFFTYAIEWTPDKIDWYIDDAKVYTYSKPVGSDYRSWPFNDKFYLILNLAIGGQWGGSQGIDPAIFPLKFIIDYVRIYKWQSNPGPYTLTTETSTGGTVAVIPRQETYIAGTPVQLTAFPDNGYYFGGFLYMGNANPITIEMVDDLTVIPLFFKSGELIKNGTFDRGLFGWNNIYINDNLTQSAVTDWESGTYVFKILKPATEWWHLGDQWLGIPVKQGKTYKVSFDAWADNPGQLGISLSRNYGNYAAYYENPSIAITQTKTNYNWQFTFNNASDNNCRLYFGFGRFSGKIYIDNISMTELVTTGTEEIDDVSQPVISAGTEPSTGRIHIYLTLVQPENVNLTLYNLQGVKLATIYNGYLHEGSHSMETPLQKALFPPGIYFLQFKGSSHTSSIKFPLF